MQSSAILFLTSLVVASAASEDFLAPRKLSSPEEVFQKYYDLVVKDADVNKTISELLDWAKEEVQKSAGEIEANLKETGYINGLGHGQQFNLLWPGAGYSSVSCGGQFEVLSLLQKQGMLHIGGIVGASGGATSAILALADTNSEWLSSSSRSLLFYYHVMEAYKTDTGDKENYQLAPYLVNLYEHAIRGDDSFASVQHRYAPMAVCSKSPFWFGAVNTGFFNCATRQQCAQATQASGEATVKGFSTGDAINGVEGACRDGGSVSSFPGAGNISNIFFNSYYGMDKVTTITLDSIKELFKAGVTDTISLLKSPKLQVPCTGECSKLAKVRAEVQAANACETRGTCTQWYDMQSGSSTTTPSGCHA